jgi:hypothetical protein
LKLVAAEPLEMPTLLNPLKQGVGNRTAIIHLGDDLNAGWERAWQAICARAYDNKPTPRYRLFGLGKQLKPPPGWDRFCELENRRNTLDCVTFSG